MIVFVSTQFICRLQLGQANLLGGSNFLLSHAGGGHILKLGSGQSGRPLYNWLTVAEYPDFSVDGEASVERLNKRTRFLLYGLLAVLVALGAVSCGEDSVSPVKIDTTPKEWYQMTALPNSAGWQTVWALSPDTLFAVGKAGDIYQGNAAGDWTELDGGHSAILYSVWATADSATVVGDSGLILNYDYNTFEERSVGLTATFFHDVWGFSDSSIFVVGRYGRILHFDGDRWGFVTYPPDTAYTATELLSVWGTSPENVYITGGRGAMLHLSLTDSDTSLTVVNAHTAADLWDVFGFSETSIYAVGSGGTIVHFDGSKWSKMETPVDVDLAGIWGLSDNDIYAVGAAGTILHYDGSVWTEEDSPTEFTLLTIWGTSANHIYAAGATTLMYDGVNWEIANISEQPDMFDIWAYSSSAALAVGTGGKIYAFNGQAWSSNTSPTEEDLHGVWGNGPGNFRFAVGDNGTILALDLDVGDWTDASGVTSENLKAVWGTDDSTVFAVGNNGTVLEYDGVSWDTMTLGSAVNLTDIYGTSDTIMYACSDNGWVFKYDTTKTWRAVYTLGGVPYNSVWVRAENDVFVVGDNGTILHFNGTTWETQSSGTTSDLLCVWGQDGNDVFAGGRDGLILQYDGNTWEAQDNPVRVDLYGIDGITKNNIFVAGAQNHLLRYLE